MLNKVLIRSSIKIYFLSSTHGDQWCAMKLPFEKAAKITPIHFLYLANTYSVYKQGCFLIGPQSSNQKPSF